jgi:hypothetical protein
LALMHSSIRIIGYYTTLKSAETTMGSGAFIFAVLRFIG